MTRPHSRRQFLQIGAGALAISRAFAQLSGPAAPSSASPKRARITSSVMVWTLHGSMEEKIATAARAGIQSIELVTEHMAWTDADVKKYTSLLRSYGMGLDAILASDKWTTRPVSMVNPEHREGFLKDVSAAMTWSKKLGNPQIIIMSGNEQPNMTHEAQFESMVEGAKRAADLAEKENATLILENLNSKVNHKGYFLTSARESLKAVKQVNNPHLRMLFDIYHEGVQHGDPIPVIQEAVDYVNVFHVADEPGRHDPGTGQMKWDDIYRAIGKTNYSGIIALEYLPVKDEEKSLEAALTQMRRDLNNAASPVA